MNFLFNLPERIGILLKIHFKHLSLLKLVLPVVKNQIPSWKFFYQCLSERSKSVILVWFCKLSACAWLIPSNTYFYTKWNFFQDDKRKKFPVMRLINLLFPRHSHLILTLYSFPGKVSFYLVSKIGKLKIEKKLPNFGFVTNIRSSRSRHVTLFKKSLWHRCIPVNFAKF